MQKALRVQCAATESARAYTFMWQVGGLIWAAVGLTASPLSSAPPNYAVKVSVYAPNMPGNFTASRNKLSLPPSVLQKCCLSLGLREFQAFCLFHCLFRGCSPVVLLSHLIWDFSVIFLLIFEVNVRVKGNYCLFQITLLTIGKKGTESCSLQTSLELYKTGVLFKEFKEMCSKLDCGFLESQPTRT